MRPLKIALLGLGTVGSGVYKILSDFDGGLSDRTGRKLVISHILVRDAAKDRSVSVPPGLLTTNYAEILGSDVDLVVEVMGGIEPALSYLRKAIISGKHVVTANKELLAKHGRELLSLADDKGVHFHFEAAVAGGIPVIKALKESLAANKVGQVMGIINGTTNYILTRMSDEGVSLEEALAEAQDKGYAEADPTNDIDGHDAAYKLAILGSIAFGSRVNIGSVFTEGIRKVTPIDLEYGRQLGYTLKLLAIAKETGAGVEARVHPTFIPNRHPLASVGDVYNAIYIVGDAVGELMFFGRGAGDMPTASAVCSDIIDVARDSGPPQVCSCLYSKNQLSMSQTISRYYIRISVQDQPGVLGRIAEKFGNNEVSLQSVIQLGREEPVHLVFVTHDVSEANIERAIQGITGLDCVYNVENLIRVEGEA